MASSTPPAQPTPIGPATPATAGPTVPAQPASPSAKAALRPVARAKLPFAGRLPDSWQVRLPAFEGPLDLLLHLIQVNQVEITDIPVALVCDQFHAYLDLMDRLDLDIAGDFVYMASYLVHLKSKMLLPRPRDLAGREVDEDPRQDLVERLLEYRKLKEAAKELAQVDSLRRGIWTRKADDLRRIAKALEGKEVELEELSLFDLLKTFKTVLDRFEQENPEPLRMIGEVFSVRGQFERLLATLGDGKRIDLFDDLSTLSGRREAIAAFLAVLELAKLQLIRLRTRGDRLWLERTERDLDRDELEAITS